MSFKLSLLAIIFLLSHVALSLILSVSPRSGFKRTQYLLSSKDENFDIRKAENIPVEKGLTHIKNNKYAPPPELAAKMTQEQFRDWIYKEMKAAERIRRDAQGGKVGSQISDDYINSLSKKSE